jgi:hypothetical protein
MFRKNVLLPSSGRMSLVQVDAEIIRRKLFAGYIGRFQGIFASRSCGRRETGRYFRRESVTLKIEAL